MSLFSGIGKLGKTEASANDKKVASAPVPEKKPVPAPKPKPQVNEADLIFDKSYTCPVCDHKFRSKTIKTGKVHLVSQDTDLRPKHSHIDSIKYDVIVCPSCGYAALGRFFPSVMPTQAKFIQENITRNFRGIPEVESVYTYDYALKNYQLALDNANVKKAKPSEKAYTSLKMAWLYRGKAETLDESSPSYNETISELNKKETELMLKAYDGFKEAFEKEAFPICGMDELTVTYLVAELARRAGDYDESARWISRVLTSRVASERIKEKARVIKELIEENRTTEETEEAK